MGHSHSTSIFTQSSCSSCLPTMAAPVNPTNHNQYLEPKHGNGIHDHELGQTTTAGSGAGLVGGGGGPIGRQISVTLTPEQFEQLYLQPGGVGGKGDLTKRFGNPTPVAIAGFLVCLTPLSIYLMGFGSSDASSAVSQVGANYILGGVLLIIAGILEFVLGNDPAVGVASAFAEGAASPALNSGTAIYLACWGVLIFIYTLGSLRTNMVFVALFFTLDIAFFLLSAAYFRIAEGRDPTSLLTAGGAFAFVTSICGWYIMLALILGSTGFPFSVPLGDLSGFMSKKTK